MVRRWLLSTLLALGGCYHYRLSPVGPDQQPAGIGCRPRFQRVPEQAARAHELSEGGHVRGKLVLSVSAAVMALGGCWAGHALDGCKYQ